MSGGLQRKALVRKGEGCRTPTSGAVEGGHISVRTQKEWIFVRGKAGEALSGLAL